MQADGLDTDTGGQTRPAAGGRRIPAGWVSSRPRAERARLAAEVLRRRILAGGFADGVLPDEAILAKEIGASRNAIREALDSLRSEGLITRRRGVGTTVVTSKFGHGLDRLAGLAEALYGYGVVTNKVRLAEVVDHVPVEVADSLELPRGASAVRLERLRLLDGTPLSLDTSYLPLDLGTAVLRGDLARRDVFALIEEAGSPLGSAEVTVHASNAEPEEAALLAVPPGTAIFTIERLTRLADGRPADAEWLRIRADRLALRATLYRGQQMDRG